MSQSLKVAIIGGSIAGITLARGLQQYPHIDFHVFEQKSTCKERGAEVSLAKNAQTALDAMGLNNEEEFKAAHSVKLDSTFGRAASGDYKGQNIFTLPGGIQAVARDEWLKQLLKGVDESRLHTSKKLTSVVEPDKGDDTATYVLKFDDESEFEADAIVGCDGSRSILRKMIIGPEDPNNVNVVFGGYWDARGTLKTERAAEIFGTTLFDPRKFEEVCLVGKDTLLLCVPTDMGENYHVIVSAIAGSNYDQDARKVKVTKNFLEESYKDWDDYIRKGITESFQKDGCESGTVWSQWESPPTHTYYRERLCIIGDAAHCTTPWIGQGAAMATEDAAVLARLLGSLESSNDLKSAFQAFDHVRRGRPEKVIENSRKAAKLMTGQNGLNPNETKLLESEKWWTDIWDINMEEHVTEALRYCKHLIEKI